MKSKLQTIGLSIFALLIFGGLISGCANSPDPRASLYQSATYYDYIQKDFVTYVEKSRDWLKDNRTFITADHEKELNMNAPYVLYPEQKGEKAVLLFHGLGDSPYTFSDVSKTLVKQGFVVQVLLLPGHGSKPEALMLPTYQDWQHIVDHYAGLLKSRYENVWLGGFSTGANLVTIHALDKGNVEGLLLFSPGFQSQAGSLEKLTPLMVSVFDWGWRAEETNIAKYTSSPLNGALAYTKSAEVLRAKLSKKTLNIPSLFVMSEADSVIDTQAIKDLYEQKFTHSQNQMIWYGEDKQSQQNIEQVSMKLPMFKISTGSHMSVMFKPCNPYYGRLAEKRICENSFNPHDESKCEAGEAVWFSAWGYTEEDKVHARLTWNPYYASLENTIGTLTNLQGG